MLRFSTALLIATISTLSFGTQLSSHSAAAVDAMLHSGSQSDLNEHYSDYDDDDLLGW